VSIAVSRVLAGAEKDLSEPVLTQAALSFASDVPRALARLFEGVVVALAGRTIEPEEEEAPPSAYMGGIAEQLPQWVPARRMIGGFYVVRSLGVGGSGTVFVVTRADDRHDPTAERFALKVPDYTATAARSLSEAEFLQLFRAEASALMSLPSQKNLAKFVTFDMSAKPKPILVMELIEGLSLERMIESRAFDMPKCIQVLDDVLAGLETMHSAGVGHLDLKPSNVVLRKDGSAVLVDFGLAGRNVRPGCATGPYGAPEVWGAETSGGAPLASAADAYAFGCLAFEALTGRTLFSAPNEVAQVAMHLAHDGMPPPVKRLAGDEKFGPLGEMLFNVLRRDGRSRMSVADTRRTLAGVRKKLEATPWPLPVG
jgi:serine/threonine protein kinase